MERKYRILLITMSQVEIISMQKKLGAVSSHNLDLLPLRSPRALAGLSPVQHGFSQSINTARYLSVASVESREQSQSTSRLFSFLFFFQVSGPCKAPGEMARDATPFHPACRGPAWLSCFGTTTPPGGGPLCRCPTRGRSPRKN